MDLLTNNILLFFKYVNNIKKFVILLLNNDYLNALRELFLSDKSTV